MDLGENIYRFRTERNMSQGALADALDVSRQSVSKWENNSAVPELEKLIKMIELFGVSLDELVTGRPATISDKESSNFATLRHLPPQQLAAAILLVCSFAVFLVISGTKSPLIGLLLTTPFLICAVVCFFIRRNIGVWCIWVVYLCLLFSPLDLVASAYDIYFPNIYDVYMKYTMTVQLLTLLGTVLLMFRQPITLDRRRTLLYCAGWLIWIPYFIVRVVRYIKCEAEIGIVFSFDLTDDPGFPLFVLLTTIAARLLYQRWTAQRKDGIIS